ncbi:MAG: hypothetical protein RLZZ291_344, partial [Actinomycetota bacterium]
MIVRPSAIYCERLEMKKLFKVIPLLIAA